MDTITRDLYDVAARLLREDDAGEYTVGLVEDARAAIERADEQRLAETPADIDHRAVADAMQRFGGGFVQALGLALSRADAENRRRILAAWPQYIRHYAGVAARWTAGRA